VGNGDGGLEHSTYWAIKKGTPEYDALAPAEQAKLGKMQASILHALELVPKGQTVGTEITGTLVVGTGADERRQEIVLKVPKDWNGKLVVVGTPGTRNEFANDGTIAPWILKRGYAYISGNKGMTNGGVDGNATLLNKMHPTRHWGEMMLDLATWASERLAEVTCTPPTQVYAVGLSNGGYQVRRALEIDHARVQGGSARIFAGGLDWSGAYWPDQRVLDKDQNGTVTPAEYAAANHLVSTNEKAALTMKWAYDPMTYSTPAAYQEMPKFSGAQAAMKAAEAVDQCLSQIIPRALAHNYACILIADHGNSDYMINEDGTPNTAHTKNPVPCVLVSKKLGDTVRLRNGRLADVAPTLLDLLGIPQPADMTGKSLIEDINP
jgi:hypothetical protein